MDMIATSFDMLMLPCEGEEDFDVITLTTKEHYEIRHCGELWRRTIAPHGYISTSRRLAASPTRELILRVSFDQESG
jgi:hypothetical protein